MTEQCCGHATARVGKVIKPGFSLPGFFGFFQMEFEKTRVFLFFFQNLTIKSTENLEFEKKMSFSHMRKIL